MKKIGILFAVGLLVILSAPAFADQAEYDAGRQYAADHPNAGESDCQRGSEDFTAGCMDYLVEDVGIQLGGK